MTMHPRPRLLRTEPASSFPPPSPSGNGPDDAAKTASLSVAPGAHMIVVRRGTDDRAVPVTLKSGAQLSQYFDMSPSSAAVPKRGRISVVTDPAGARVSVDGQARGVSPVTIVDL